MDLVHNSIPINPFFISDNKKLLRKNNLFWIGFIIYTLSFTVAQTTFINFAVIQVFQLAGLALLIPNALSIVNFKFESQYLKAFFYIFCCWSLTIVLRGFNLNSDFLKEMLFDAGYGLFPYLVPLVLLFPKKLSFYKKIFFVIIVLDGFYILYDAIFIKNLLNSDRTNLLSLGIVEQFSRMLSVCNGFILLTFFYHSNKRKLFAVAISVLTLLFAIVRARRGLIFISASTLLFAYILYLMYSRERKLAILIGLLIASVLFYKVKQAIQEGSGVFSSLSEHFDEDTRSGVEMCFYSDLTTRDWIIGKGINGQYYCPILDENISGYRTVIETDYLQLILRGGIINLVLLLLIMIPAVINGLFFSRNLLSKAAGAWILLWLFYLYPTSVTTFSLHYILVWMCVGICYSKKIRNIPESVMRRYFLTGQ
jgi:hypothetical protein